LETTELPFNYSVLNVLGFRMAGSSSSHFPAGRLPSCMNIFKKPFQDELVFPDADPDIELDTTF
jgi:hypothetical protein